MKRTIVFLLSLSMTVLPGCGGGGGSDSSDAMLIEGTLTENGGAHSKAAILKHSVGEHIENVQICALGECSETDAEGRWGFVTDSTFTGGAADFTIKGHGIDTATVVEIPRGAKNVVIDFEHVEGGIVQASEITVVE